MSHEHNIYMLCIWCAVETTLSASGDVEYSYDEESYIDDDHIIEETDAWLVIGMCEDGGE